MYDGCTTSGGWRAAHALNSSVACVRTMLLPMRRCCRDEQGEKMIGFSTCGRATYDETTLNARGYVAHARGVVYVSRVRLDPLEYWRFIMHSAGMNAAPG